VRYFPSRLQRSSTRTYRTVLAGSIIGLALACPSLANEHDIFFRKVYIGLGNVSVQIPRRAIVDFQPGFEMTWYHVVDPASRFGAVDIGITAGTADVILSGRASSFCLNGLRGTTLIEDGVRNIAVKLPDSTGNHYLIFGFDEGDRSAWETAKSAAVFGKRGSCSSTGPRAVNKR
jgi:hypothetical protein